MQIPDSKQYWISPSSSPPDHHPSKRDKTSPMRLMHWPKSREYSTAGEINRRMQRALEEALMKNIHLQEVSCTIRLSNPSEVV